MKVSCSLWQVPPATIAGAFMKLKQPDFVKRVHRTHLYSHSRNQTLIKAAPKPVHPGHVGLPDDHDLLAVADARGAHAARHRPHRRARTRVKGRTGRHDLRHQPPHPARRRPVPRRRRGLGGRLHQPAERGEHGAATAPAATGPLLGRRARHRRAGGLFALRSGRQAGQPAPVERSAVGTGRGNVRRQRPARLQHHQHAPARRPRLGRATTSC